jgi:hypothetical protein
MEDGALPRPFTPVHRPEEIAERSASRYSGQHTPASRLAPCLCLEAKPPEKAVPPDGFLISRRALTQRSPVSESPAPGEPSSQARLDLRG